MLAGASGAQAGTITDTDNTKVVSYWGTNPTDWFRGTSIGDVVEGGPTFDTEEVIITQTGLTLSFDFITQFDGSDLGASYADIFLATNPAAPDSYDYGISLGFQGGNGGVATGPVRSWELRDLRGHLGFKNRLYLWRRVYFPERR